MLVAEMIAQGNVVDEFVPGVLHHIHAPYCTPPWSDMPVPCKVICIDAGIPLRQRRIAYLGYYRLFFVEMISGGASECESLVDLGTEHAVEIDVDRCGIILISSYQYSIFPEEKAPVVVGLPVEVQDVRSVEQVVLVVLLFAETVAESIVDCRGDVTQNMDVEMIPTELAAIVAVGDFLVEGCPGIEEKTIDFFLCKASQGQEEHDCTEEESIHFRHLNRRN